MCFINSYTNFKSYILIFDLGMNWVTIFFYKFFWGKPLTKLYISIYLHFNILGNISPWCDTTKILDTAKAMKNKFHRQKPGKTKYKPKGWEP